METNRTHRIRTEHFTVTTVYRKDIGGYKVGLSFCSNLDQPNHAKGKLIATGRLEKYPLYFEPIREDLGEHDFIVGSVIRYLDEYYSRYNLATKVRKIEMEKSTRIPRWVGDFLMEYYQRVNLKYWNDVVINKENIHE
jgi:hypothetical protein